MTPHTTPSTREQITVTGGQLLEHAQRLLHEGNIRRIVLSHEGQTIAEFPLTFGVVGAVLASVLAAMGALAALVTECTIEIERAEDVPRSETMRPLGAFMGRRAAREADAISHGGLAAGPGGPEGDPREKGSSQSRQRTSSARGMHNRERAQRYRGAVTMQEKDPTLFFERTTCERIALGAHGAAHYPA